MTNRETKHFYLILSFIICFQILNVSLLFLSAHYGHSLGEAFITPTMYFQVLGFIYPYVALNEIKKLSSKDRDPISWPFRLHYILFCLNNTLNDPLKTWQRMRAADYFLKCIFHHDPQFTQDQELQEWIEKELNGLFELQQMGYKNDSEYTNKMMFRFIPDWITCNAKFWIMIQIWYHLTYIAYIVNLACLFYAVKPVIKKWNADYIIMVIIVSIVYLILLIGYYKVCHIIKRISVCNYFSEEFISLRWQQIFDSVEDMILGMDAVYYLMFGQLEEVKIVYDVLYNVEDEFEYHIADLIAEFLWYPLPTISNIDTFQEELVSGSIDFGSGA